MGLRPTQGDEKRLLPEAILAKPRTYFTVTGCHSSIGLPSGS